MSPRPPSIGASQRGAALISVIFLVVVVATLGAFAVRTGIDQQQVATLSLIEARADAAAYSGVEYASYMLRTGQPCPATLPPAAGLQDFTVSLQCSAALTTAGSANVFRIIATARHGAFGGPDFVQRVHERRVSTIGSGSW